MGNQWFRAYSSMIDDEKLRLLAFEDRWHFIAILCLKSDGIIDTDDTDNLMRRKVAVKMGIDIATLDEVSRRLAEVGLINRETLQPVAWEKRQFKSDCDSGAAERMRNLRARKKAHFLNSSNELRNGSNHMRNSYVTVTDELRPPETETETEITYINSSLVNTSVCTAKSDCETTANDCETTANHKCGISANKKNSQKPISSQGKETEINQGKAAYITRKKRVLSGKRLDSFERFWAAFDDKRGRAEAADAWMDIPQLTMAMVDRIVLAAEAYARERPRMVKDGKTPKMPQGWISSRRWEDELPCQAHHGANEITSEMLYEN